MSHLLDSDIVIRQIAGDPVVDRHLRPLVVAGLAFSIVTYMEVYQGVLRRPDRAPAEAELAAFLSAVVIIAFTTVEAERAAVIRHALQLLGRRIRPRALDLLTAATALAHDLTLVTSNIDDYKDTPGLKLLHVP
jgi:tRNA(fMet)-specific endonuclease VapC